MSEKTYYDYQDIMRLCFVSRSRAYELIAMLNKELKDSGYIVPKLGRVPCDYANKRLRITA